MASSGLCWLLLVHLGEQGVDVAALVRKAGLRLGDFLNTEVRMPLPKIHAIWRAAAELLNDDALGVVVLKRIAPDSTFSWPAPFALHEHLGRASATLREAAPLQSRFIRLLRDGLSLSLDEAAAGPMIRFEFTLANEPRPLIHFHLASSVLYARRVLNDKDAAPAGVWFAEPKPRDEQGFVDFFRAPLRWDAECYAVVAERAVFDRPISSGNPLLRSVLERRAEQTLQALPSIEGIVESVREYLEAELSGGNTNASWIAEKLGISQRTLHRRLQSEGTSYQDVLDKLRCKLATRYLLARKHTINEVAALVGFAQPSAFHRAFKSWTGETPSDYQERNANATLPASPPRRG